MDGKVFRLCHNLYYAIMTYGWQRYGKYQTSEFIEYGNFSNSNIFHLIFATLLRNPIYFSIVNIKIQCTNYTNVIN